MALAAVFALSLLTLGALLAACGSEEPSGSSAADGASAAEGSAPAGAAATTPEEEAHAQGEPGTAGAAQDPDPVIGPRAADMSKLVVRTVMDETGAPVAGVRVRLLWKSGENETDVGRDRQLTGADGGATFEILGGTLVQSVAAEPSTLTAPEALIIKKPILPATEVELELRLKPAGVVAGVVRDIEGQPILDAEVLVWFADRWEVENEVGKPFDVSGLSREKGSFTLGGLPQGKFLLDARKEGWVAVQRVNGRIKTGQVLDGFELVMVPAKPYYGRVVDEDGNPVPGAELLAGVIGRYAKNEPTMTDQAVYVPAGQYLLKSGKDGGFVIPARSPDEMWVVEARHPRFQEARHRVLPGEGSGDVIMRQGFSLRGQILDAERDPVPRATLRLYGEQSRPFRSGEGGGFRVDGLKEDLEAAVVAHKPGYAATLLWPFEIGPDAEALRIQLFPGSTLSGRVLSADGSGVPGVRLQIVEGTPESPLASLPFPGKTPLAEFGLDQALTAADGNFLFTDLPAGEVTLQILDESGSVLKEIRTETGKDPLEIRLD